MTALDAEGREKLVPSWDERADDRFGIKEFINKPSKSNKKSADAYSNYKENAVKRLALY